MKAPSLVVGGDGSHLAMVEEGRVTVVDVQTMTALAEIGLPGPVADSDVALVGNPPKLLVITRLAGETRLFVVDPAGPEKLGEATIRANLRLGAIADEWVLLIGATTALVDLRSVERPPSTLPVRGAVLAAGSLGGTHMVLAMSGAIEEWDASTRAPVRRLRLDRPLDVVMIGGSERRMWMVPRAAPQRIEIVSSETRSTRSVDLPEPITHLHAHDRVDVLIAVGADAAYIVRADREQLVRVPRGPLHDCVWVKNQLVVWPVDGYPELVTAPIDLGESAGSDGEALEDEEEPAAPAPALPAEVRAELASQNLRAPMTTPTFSERLASWKSKLEESRNAPVTTPMAPEIAAANATAQILERRTAGGWRGEIAAWARAIAGRSHRPMPFLDPPLLDEMMVRLGLGAELRPAIVLLYGAHLNGGDGVSRYDLASVLDWRWAAIPEGPLASSGIVRAKKSRFSLVREAACALDEAPPRRGTLIGAGTGASDSALVAPATIDPAELSAWGEKLAHAPLLVANERGKARLDRFVLEARIRGAVPVVPDDATADRFGLAVLGRWPGLGVA